MNKQYAFINMYLPFDLSFNLHHFWDPKDALF